jgi:hypothetical protein
MAPCRHRVAPCRDRAPPRRELNGRAYVTSPGAPFATLARLRDSSTWGETMLYRNWTMIGAIAAFTAGCGGQAPEVSVKKGARFVPQALAVECQDPATCTTTNGSGIYYQEMGKAGIDIDSSTTLYITHFYNDPDGSVGFQGRYHWGNQDWQSLPGPGGVVRTADYNGQRYNVTGIFESGTRVWFRLASPTTNGRASRPIWVHDEGLLNLALHIGLNDPRFVDPLGLAYTLTFDSASSTPDSSGKNPVFVYNVLWQEDYGASPPQQYCFGWDTKDVDSAGSYSNDTAVFQSGFDVDPVNGTVTTAANEVTFSCRKGAPATVYSWGYDYAKEPWHFSSGIHMKRAAYCGDSRFYTFSGTRISIQDSMGIVNDAFGGVAGPSAFDQTLEAFWTPTGAACYNAANRRHPEIYFWPDCPEVDGRPAHTVPPCSQSPYYDSVEDAATVRATGDSLLPFFFLMYLSDAKLPQ